MFDDSWKGDVELQEKLKQYVKEALKREEILSFLRRDFSQYQWSIRTLDRRLRYFDIYYSDKNVTVHKVREAVAEELDGPGKLLGYRAMQKKIRLEHNLNVPRDVVYAAMYDQDPEGLERRTLAAKAKKPKGSFTTRGTNWVHSLDCHDKLIGFQNNTFPIAIYGCLDTASRKLLWLKMWVSNNKPELIGRWYLEYLYESRVIASYLRLDKGTETGIMATIHAEPCDTVLYGPSTSNQVQYSNINY